VSEGIRYTTTTRSGGILLRGGRLLPSRLVAWTESNHAILFDHTRYPQHPIGAYVAPVDGASELHPPPPYAVTLERGLYVSFSTEGHQDRGGRMLIGFEQAGQAGSRI